MIFRNTFRLILTNFSNVWKVLVYYIICIALTVVVCWWVASPIIGKLTEAHIFEDFGKLVTNAFFENNNFFSTKIESLNNILERAWGVLSTNIQFRFNYIFLIVWVVFVLPFTLDLAQLPLCEVIYGYMTSQVKYTFTGRFVKNIGKSCVYSLSKFAVQFVFNLVNLFILILIVKLFAVGTIAYVLLDVLLFAVLILFISFKYTLFACWVPGVAVLNCKVFKALKENFKFVFRKFFNIFSNCLSLVLLAFAVNFLFCFYTFGVGLVVVLPLTALAFIIFQMVSYFFLHGMRFYAYPDNIVRPKTFEEEDSIKKVKYLI